MFVASVFLINNELTAPHLHMFFVYPKYNEERQRLKTGIGEFALPDNLATVTLHDQEK